MRCALLLVLATGCYIGPTAPPPQPPPQPPPPGYQQPGPQPSAAQTLRSVWQGTYTCPQGETALRLSVEQRCVGGGCEVTGTFEFGPPPSNPSVPHGSYRMRGQVGANDRGEAVLQLTPDTWIDQPAGYGMVGFTATTDPNQQIMRGRIDNPQCGEVALGRVE